MEIELQCPDCKGTAVIHTITFLVDGIRVEGECKKNYGCRHWIERTYTAVIEDE